MPQWRPIQLLPVIPPGWHELVHQGNEAAIVRVFKQVRQLMYDDVLQAFRWLLVRLGAQFVDCAADLCRGVVVFGKVGGEQIFFDVAVVGAVGPIAKVVIVEFVAEEGDDPVLGYFFWLADGCHGFRRQLLADKSGLQLR